MARRALEQRLIRRAVQGRGLREAERVPGLIEREDHHLRRAVGQELGEGLSVYGGRRRLARGLRSSAVTGQRGATQGHAERRQRESGTS